MRIQRLYLSLLLLSLIALAGNVFGQVQLTVTMSSTPTCSLDGSATATVTNGTPPYTYQWYGPSGNQVGTTSTITGLGGGFYYCQVWDANNFTGWGTVSLAYPFQVNVTSTNDVCNAGVGTATASVTSGGTGPFSYLWSTGATGPTITGLQQGTYDLTVTDAIGCIVTSEDSSAQALVWDTSPVTFTVSTTGSQCNDGTASVTNIQGGTPPYTYTWSTTPVQYTPSISNVPGSTWGYVTVTDAAGCATSNWFWVNQLPNGLFANTNVTPETCIQANGTASITVTGGSAPYTYLWSNGATTASVSGLSYGSYSVTATDANGCPIVKGVSVGRTDPLTLTYTTTAPNCFNQGGAINMTVTGGTPPYSYAWGNGATTQNLSNLGQGYYSVTVTDANGCYDHTYLYLTIPSSCLGMISGHVLGDVNSNCVNDVPDFPWSYQLIQVGPQWAATDLSGYYEEVVLPGTYTVGMSQAPNYFAQTCPATPGTYSVNISTPGQVVANQDFFVEPSTVVNDLRISMYAQPARPTALQSVWLYWRNDGSVTQSATVTYTHDALMTLYSATGMTGYNSSTRTVTFALGTVYPGQTGSIYLSFSIPQTTPLGTPYTESCEITPVSGDATPLNNVDSNTGAVVASYDPNDKAVTPDGQIELTDSVLTYRIRFQNTGNDTAFTVMIQDTMDSDLDLSTFQVLGASHPFTLNVENPTVVQFLFDHIMLPDSHINEPASHGHVIYRIHTKPNLPIGTHIDNKAEIFFDFNPPVITNTTHNILGVVGVDDPKAAVQGFELFPNPASSHVNIRFNAAWEGVTEVSVRDLSGRLMQRLAVDPAQSRAQDLNLAGLARGVYLVECQNGMTREVKKLVLQ